MSNTTKTTDNKVEFIKAYSLDELYIECYLDNPSNKSAALRKAAQIAGVKADTSRQRAREIHRRLQHQIDKGLLKRMLDGATLGYAVTYSLAADENINPAIRLKASENLIEYAGKSRPESKEIQRDRGDINEDIKQTRIRIAQLTGNTHD